MSTRQRFPWGERWCERVGALALVALVLLGACATGGQPPTRRESQEGWERTSVSRGEREGEDARVFVRLPTDFEPVRVGDAEFKDALVTLVLEMPLRVASSAPVWPGRGLAPGTGGSGGEAWQSDMARSYGGMCERRGTPGDCLTLLDDGPHLQADDKRAIALALAVGPALEGVDAELRAMLDPTRVLATVSIAITGYMALLLAPNGITRALGSPGKGNRWHHIVEQHKDNIERFGPEAIHNTENVIPLEEGLHTDLSSFYSSKQELITGSPDLTVRQWIKTQSYEAQRQFGLTAIENVRNGIWRVQK